jgi:uncharacterized membrane protein YdbT with pleckstrin-like domain
MAYLDDLLARGETIKLISHRHIIAMILRTVLYVIGAIVVLILAVAALSFIPTAGGIVALVLVVVALVEFGIAAYRFMWWRSEQYVITNYRIIQVEGVINKRTFDSALEKVNDVIMTQKLLGRTLGFGDIKILTGSDSAINDLSMIADPVTFKRVLQETKFALGPDGEGVPSRSSAVERMERQLTALAELRDSGVISDDEYDERKQQLLQKA